MAKIATTMIASGEGWSVLDLVCSSGPRDRPFEEQHEHAAIAIVTGGTFQYRGSGAGVGRELMTPGSLLLGNPGQRFECGHEHTHGDRCLAFHYTPQYFAAVTDGVGRGRFASLRLPPVRELSSVVARASAALKVSLPPSSVAWEELAIRLAVQALRVDHGRAISPLPVSSAAAARVTRTIEFIERHASEAVVLTSLATQAGLSPFHFLRIFEDLTGTTPHQYVMRLRLRRAASQLLTGSVKILDVALDSGFADISNFNRAFRTEFGVNPRTYRNRLFDHILTDS